MKTKFQIVRSTLGWVVVVMLLLLTTHLRAQQTTPALPEYTDAQRWGRIASLNVSIVVSEIELGKARGMTIDEIGIWLGNYFAGTWTGGLDARSLATAIRWNVLSDPDVKVEMTTFSDTLVVMRYNPGILNDFGPDGRLRGVTLDEYKQTFDHINRIIAEQVGVKLESHYEGDWLVLTLRNGYKPLKASDEVRWNRAAAVMRYIILDVIRTGKSAGKTPGEIGLATAKAWEGTWTGADTPWRLLRGIAWNNFTDPEFVCEILSASPALVRAKFNKPWLAAVRNNEKYTGVTVDDYEAYQLGLEQGIAALRGMTWEVVPEGDNRIITVRKK